MTEIIALAIELLGLLKPHISPTEYDRRLKELWAVEEKNDKLKTEIKKALAAGDVSLLNSLLSLLLGDGL